LSRGIEETRAGATGSAVFSGPQRQLSNGSWSVGWPGAVQNLHRADDTNMTFTGDPTATFTAGS